MKLTVLLLAAVAAAGSTGSVSGRVLDGAERVESQTWTTSSGVSVVCGGPRRPSDRLPLIRELQLSALLDSVCRYLDSKRLLADIRLHYQSEQGQNISVDSSQSVR